MIYILNDMARQPNPNRKNSPSMLAKTTKLRLDKHRKPLNVLHPDNKKLRTGNESDDQLINRLLDHFEKSFAPSVTGLSTYTKKVEAPTATTI